MIIPPNYRDPFVVVRPDCPTHSSCSQATPQAGIAASGVGVAGRGCGRSTPLTGARPQRLRAGAEHAADSRADGGGGGAPSLGSCCEESASRVTESAGRGGAQELVGSPAGAYGVGIQGGRARKVMVRGTITAAKGRPCRRLPRFDEFCQICTESTKVDRTRPKSTLRCPNRSTIHRCRLKLATVASS